MIRMKKTPRIALAILVGVAFATGAFAQVFTEPRQDTVPLPAPTGQKVTKPEKPMKEESGVKEESTAESEGKKADEKPSPKAPRDGTHPGQ